MARSQEEIGQIVQSSLESIQAGRDTLDSILARYPDLVDSLRPELEMALWLSSLKGTLDPRPGFVRESRARLVAQLKQESLKESAPRKPMGRSHTRERRGGLFPQRRFTLQFAMILFLVICFSLLSSGIVLGAQYSAPGDLFYPIKIAQEQIQVAASFSEARETQLYTRFAERRLVEIQTLILEDSYGQIQETVERYQEQMDQAASSLEEVAGQDPEQAKALAASLQQSVEKQAPAITALIDVVPSQTRPLISQALQISEQAVNTAQEIISEEEPGGPVAPAGTPSPAFTSTSTPGSLPSPTATLVPATALPTLETPAPPLPTATVSFGVPYPMGTDTAVPTGTPTHDEPPEPDREPTATDKPTPEKTRTPPGQEKTAEPTASPSPEMTQTNEPPTSTPEPDQTQAPPTEPTPYPAPGQDLTGDLPPGQAKKTETPAPTPTEEPKPTRKPDAGQPTARPFPYPGP